MKNEFEIGDTIRFIGDKNEVSETLTVGKTYEVLGLDYDGCPRIKNDYGGVFAYMSYRFEKVNFLFEDIKRAKSMIGKTVKDGNDIFVPTDWGVGNIFSTNLNIQEGNVVYLESDTHIATLSNCEVVENVMKLTDDYDAIIVGDIVKVGCQNIPIEKVRGLLDLYDNLNPR